MRWLTIIFSLIVCALLFSQGSGEGGISRTILTFEDHLQNNLLSSTEDHVQRRVAIVGNCYSAFSFLKNVSESGEPISADFALLSNAANYLLYQIGQNTGLRFYNFGKTGTGFDDHFVYLYHLFRKNAADVIVYMNDYGGIFPPFSIYDFYDSKNGLSALRAVFVLEKWLLEVPSARQDILNYLAIFQAQPVYAFGVKTFGENWREDFDPVRLLPKSLQPSFLSRLKNSVIAASGMVLEKIRFLYWMDIFRLEYFLHFSADKRGEHFSNTAGNSVFYHRLNPDIQLSMADKKRNEERIRLWYRIVAKVAKEKNTDLVLYFPQNPSASPPYIESFYYPKFIQPVKEEVQSTGAKIIDDTKGCPLNSSDLAYRFIPELKSNIKMGQWTTISGTMKRAGALIRGFMNLNYIPQAELTKSVPGMLDCEKSLTGEVPVTLKQEELTDTELMKFIEYGL